MFSFTETILKMSSTRVSPSRSRKNWVTECIGSLHDCPVVDLWSLHLQEMNGEGSKYIRCIQMTLYKFGKLPQMSLWHAAMQTDVISKDDNTVSPLCMAPFRPCWNVPFSCIWYRQSSCRLQCHYNAVIFLQNLHNGVICFAGLTCDLYFASLTAVLYVISWHIVLL